MKALAPVYVVVNAGSGRKAAEEKVASLREILAQSGRVFEVLVAENGKRLPAVARQAVERAKGNAGIIVVAGGDGTINSVGQVALEHELPFGVVPQGTFNYLSRAHGIPQDPEDALRAILDGTVKPVQAGLVNDRAFFVNASVGLYPQLLEDREAYKRRYGRSRLVAVWSALVTLFHQSQQLEVDMDADGQHQHLRTPTLFVGNNRLQLEQVGIDEAPALDRDRLVAITAKPLGIVSSLRLMLRGFLGRLGEAQEVSSFTFEQLTVMVGRRRRPSRVKVATDGEIAFLATPLVFRPSPYALQLIVPKVVDGSGADGTAGAGASDAAGSNDGARASDAAASRDAAAA